MIKLNQPAPDFQAKTTAGNVFRLSELRGRPVVIFFFPKAFSPGCTSEATQFRDAHAEIQALGAEVVGVSTDDHKTQCEFASQLGLPYPMIADDQGTIAGLYDVVWPFLGMTRRVTYLIDAGGLVRGVFNHELMIDRHRDRVLDALRRMRREAPPV